MPFLRNSDLLAVSLLLLPLLLTFRTYGTITI